MAKACSSEKMVLDNQQETTIVESLCLTCGQNGVTKMLLTKIPFYKEVILMSFECDHCGANNNELQMGGVMQEKGVRYVLSVQDMTDLNRMLVKSDYTSIRIPEVDFDIPANSQKGEITTIEGVLDRAITALGQDQEKREKEHPEIMTKIKNFLGKLTDLKNLKSNFTMIIEDISGNSFLSNPNIPKEDKNVKFSTFVRTKEQDHQLCIYTQNELQSEEGPGVAVENSDQAFTYEDLDSAEVVQLPSICSQCSAPCFTNAKLTDIPHFKQVLIMATNCDQCGFRTNEVKPGGEIEPKGVKVTLLVSDSSDFSRDVLKSDTCHLKIPELELEVGPATLGGRFTTVEGLLTEIRESLRETSTLFTDSADANVSSRMKDFLSKFERVLHSEESITLVMDDPAGNSFIQMLEDGDEKLRIERYDRSYEQNDELGLNDMKTDNYGEVGTVAV